MADMIPRTGRQEEYPPRPRGDDGLPLPKDEPVPFVRDPVPVAAGTGTGAPAEAGRAPADPAPASEADAEHRPAPAIRRPITAVLVANRGEIARRIIATAHELGIRTVAVYSEPDRASAHVVEADMAVPLGGESAAESYLDVDKIIAAAKAAGADAVHPGYGFLSERAAFAQACADHDLTFVGPPAACIAAMGDKIEAKRLAAAAGVPTLPSAEIVGDDAASWVDAVAPLGYPLLVKAAAGGGGRGMRVVRDASALAEAVESARREAASAFGDGAVFAERLVERARHVEVQVFADAHGGAVHLFERECSIQRRHQKLIEEAPSPAVDADLRRQLSGAALALVRAIGYIGAGTVEFLLEADGRFWFLEMNTRLQVEHPVTEAVTGVDLVDWQFEVAAGRRLPRSQAELELRGHAVEARVCAEDPARDFLPCAGRFLRFAPPEQRRGLRVDAALSGPGVVPSSYDSLLAKVIAHAPSREQAVAVLRRGLVDFELDGVTTNRDYLVAVLAAPEFAAGRATTAFVDEHEPLRTQSLAPDVERRHVVAATIAGARQRRTCDRLWQFATPGWRNLPTQRQKISYALGGRVVGVRYEIGPGDAFVASIDGHEVRGRVLVHDETAPGSAVIVIETSAAPTVRHRVHIAGECTWVASPEGHSQLVEVARFPDAGLGAARGGCTAPVPGRVVAVTVAAGDRVAPGQVLVVLEAMKMEHRIEADTPGVVAEVHVAPGEHVDAHRLLVRLDPP